MLSSFFPGILRVFIAISATVFTLNAAAGIKIISDQPDRLVSEVTGRYIMGDADSFRDAKRLAIEDAKRTAIQHAGTYIESETIVQDFEITSDQVRTLAAAFIQTELLGEPQRTFIAGGGMAVEVQIKAIVQKGKLRAHIDSSGADGESFKRKLAEVEKQNAALQAKLDRLNQQLASQALDEDAIDRLAEERKQTLSAIEALLIKLISREPEKKIALTRDTFSEALMNGDMATLQHFAGSGRWDFSMVLRPEPGIPDAVATTVIAKVIKHNFQSIDQVLDFLVAEQALSVDDYLRASYVSEPLQSRWQTAMMSGSNQNMAAMEQLSALRAQAHRNVQASVEAQNKALKAAHDREMAAYNEAAKIRQAKMKTATPEQMQALIQEQILAIRVPILQVAPIKTDDIEQEFQRLKKASGITEQPPAAIRQPAIMGPPIAARTTLLLEAIWAENLLAVKKLLALGARIDQPAYLQFAGNQRIAFEPKTEAQRLGNRQLIALLN